MEDEREAVGKGSRRHTRRDCHRPSASWHLLSDPEVWRGKICQERMSVAHTDPSSPVSEEEVNERPEMQLLPTFLPGTQNKGSSEKTELWCLVSSCLVLPRSPKFTGVWKQLGSLLSCGSVVGITLEWLYPALDVINIMITIKIYPINFSIYALHTEVHIMEQLRDQCCDCQVWSGHKRERKKSKRRQRCAIVK